MILVIVSLRINKTVTWFNNWWKYRSDILLQLYLHSGVTRLCLLSWARSPIARTISCDTWCSCLRWDPAPNTTTPRTPGIHTIYRATVCVTPFRARQGVGTSSSTRLGDSLPPRTGRSSPTARSTTWTPWTPATNPTVGYRTPTSPSSTTSPSVWRRPHDAN